MKLKNIGMKIKCGKYSYVENLQNYKYKLGLSGTIESLHPSTKNIL